MNVNDLIVQGAEPLLFLDTYSCGKLNPDVAVGVVKGICAGCRSDIHPSVAITFWPTRSL